MDTRGKLRIYYGPRNDHGDSPVAQSPGEPRRSVTVPLEEVFPVLADAAMTQKTWLEDFADDEITISSDLYEVILAYQHYRRPSA